MRPVMNMILAPQESVSQSETMNLNRYYMIDLTVWTAKSVRFGSICNLKLWSTAIFIFEIWQGAVIRQENE
mgnify:CR=1 FL=1